MDRRYTLVLDQRTLEDARDIARLDRRPLRDQLRWVVEEWVRRERHRLTAAAPDERADPPIADVLPAAAAIA